MGPSSSEVGSTYRLDGVIIIIIVLAILGIVIRISVHVTVLVAIRDSALLPEAVDAVADVLDLGSADRDLLLVGLVLTAIREGGQGHLSSIFMELTLRWRGSGGQMAGWHHSGTGGMRGPGGLR